MNRIFVGGISPEGEAMLTSYLNVFMPDAVIEPLKAVGIKGRMKNHAKRQDVALVIIDESLYQVCVGVADDVLSLPKVHKYINDEGLSQFLIEKFGRLDGVAEPTDSAPIMESVVPHSITEEDDFNNLTFSEDSNESDEAKDNLIRDLEDRLAKSELLVHNLTIQLQDNKSDAEDDISAFIARIRELEEQLSIKDEQLQSADGDSYLAQEELAKAKQALSAVEDLKAQLRVANEAKSEITHERDMYSEEVDTLTKKISELTEELSALDSLKEELSLKASEIERLTIELEEKNLEVNTRTAEHAGIDSELGLLQTQYDDQTSKVAELTSEIAELKEKLSESELKVSNLTIDLEAKINEINSLLAEIDRLKSEIEAKDADINSSLELASDTDTKVAEISFEYEALKSRYELQTEELNAELAKTAEYLETIENLKAEIAVKTDELVKMRESEVLTSETLSVKERAIDSLVAEKKELEDKLVASEEAKLKAETDLVAFQAEYETVKQDLESKQAELSESTVTISKLENQVVSLQGSIESAKITEESVVRLENELLEERRKSARLTSEVEVLKKNEDSAKATELRLEVAKLRSELEQERVSSIPVEEFRRVQAEMMEYKDRCTQLELEGVDKDNELKELSDGVFGKLANVALPKNTYDVCLERPKNLPDRFYCMASGSLESTSSVYQLLRKTCNANSQTRYLIIDLVTDSAIDREFGTTNVKSPVNWLMGSEPFRNFLAETKFRNVKVLSTALAYLNDLALLQIDWDARLNEIKGYADVVIINVGCLNNIVAKVLFNTFSGVMKTHIVTKATPVNLRSVILSLTGFSRVDNNVIVDCVNFDDKSSKNMYQRLVQKYKAQVIKDTDVLKL